ncbi:alkaline shock response membrane anchor protein AmaP [Streptomyces sp. NBC_00335]|uniref:alkaline shock response membrane anchor protein AmaP n=1 Tax=unclassified Streptomyces TaxID=2593676 RepID=UPI0022570B76|nr:MULTISPECIES: alkaline shock response membrane anchor protein AmaP [unclassified Streptomyces]MCX5408124.1 alkaline shock response membrane anchor protein AmaP [Streptomyces sp. NBC_00086]
MTLGTVNRVLLALLGLVLLAAGASVLTASGPFQGRREPLLAPHGRGWPAPWWVVLAALGACVLLALWWLLSQLRRARLAEVLVDTGDGAFAVLRGRALEEAVEADVREAVEGVARCRVTLRGRRGAPALRVALELEPHAVPADVLAALAGPVLGRARASAALPALPTEARLHVTPRRARRVT